MPERHSMADISHALFVGGYGVLLLALCAAVASLAFSPRLAGHSGGRAWSWNAFTRPERTIPATTAALACALLGVSIALRTLAERRPPYSDMWEYLSVLSFGILVCSLVFQRRYGATAVMLLGLGLAAALLTVAIASFNWRPQPLPLALQNNRLLALHVAAMLGAYSALAVSFAASLISLAQGTTHRFRRLPPRALTERIEYRSIMTGFPILGLGIALGAYWGSYAWGRYWGWDPKETTALVSWLVYAVYMHVRAVGAWRGTRLSLVSVAGFGVILFNIFVVNFVLSGLHSYAGA